MAITYPRSAGVVTGVALTAGLFMFVAPAAARPSDTGLALVGAGTSSGSVLPVRSGLLDLRVEQHRRGGGGGNGGSSQGSSGGGGGQAVPRGGSGGGSTAGSGGGTRSDGGAATRGDDGSSGGNARRRADSGSGSGDSSATPPNSRPREGRPATGTAVQRRDGGGRGPDTIIVGGGYYGGYYPWGWGGLGLGGYYGYYDPWGGGWYDPYGASDGYGYYADGSLKLKVTPRQAEVFVDGYFAGAVDDYDGLFQRLRLEPGPHRIEVRLDGYETLSFEVRIQPDRTITYKGELQKSGEDN